MSYDGIKDGTVRNDVGIAHSVRHQTNPNAGQYGPHFRLCFSHSSRRSGGGGFNSAVRGRKLVLREKSNSHTGRTNFRLRGQNVAELNGGRSLSAVLPSWGSKIAEETIKYAATVVDPIFKILVSGLFSVKSDTKYVQSRDEKIIVRDTKKYIPVEKKRKRPLTEVLNLETGFLYSQGSGSATGKVTYELSTSATTLKKGLAGTTTPTGRVSKSNDFTVNWTSPSP